MNWSMLPLLVFGVLNVLLAFTAPRQAPQAGGAAALFGVAAALILAGVWRSNVPLVVLGLLCALAAPVWMGFLKHGQPTRSHHIVRAVIVALCFLAWVNYRPA